MLKRISINLKENNSRTILVIFCVVMAFLIPDLMINYVSDFIVPILISSWSIFFFVIVCVVFSVGSYFIVRFVSENSREIREKDRYLNINLALNSYSSSISISSNYGIPCVRYPNNLQISKLICL